MDISGTGITPFTTKVLPGFRPMTKLSIKWRQVSSGNWSGLDRGTGADVNEAKFGIYGKESPINTFIDEIDANRDADNHVITLSNFFSTEHIFGENVDHSGSITATVLKISRRRQGSWKGWGIDVTVRATAPSFTGSSSLPTLDCCDIGVRADSNYRINKYDSYQGTMAYLDHQSDSGIFEGIFTLTNANMILIRNYIKTQRTGNFTLADNFGIDYPFGTRSGNSYPFTTKLIDWEDLGWQGLLYHRIRLRFAEVV